MLRAPGRPTFAHAHGPHERDHKWPLAVRRADVAADRVGDLRQLSLLPADARLVRGLQVATGVAVVSVALIWEHGRDRGRGHLCDAAPVAAMRGAAAVRRGASRCAGGGRGLGCMRARSDTHCCCARLRVVPAMQVAHLSDTFGGACALQRYEVSFTLLCCLRKHRQRWHASLEAAAPTQWTRTMLGAHLPARTARAARLHPTADGSMIDTSPYLLKAISGQLAPAGAAQVQLAQLQVPGGQVLMTFVTALLR